MPTITRRPRARARLALLAALIAPALLAAARPAAAQSSPFDGTAGSGSYRYFFALDFRDFAAPQFYAFEYLSTAPQLTFADVLQGLQAGVPGFSIRTTNYGGSLGLSLDGITFGTKEKFNDFAGSNSGEPNGYWSQWNSLTGVSWAGNDFGISTQTVAANTWVGASWVSDYNTVTGVAPRVTPAALAAAAVPESGAAGLLALGVACAGVAVVRRRRSN
jgi:hypothetical protein